MSADLASNWDREYASQGIPSSWRNDPSGVVLWALEHIKAGSPDAASPEADAYTTALDIGCGTGRNTIAVAETLGCSAIGFDYSTEAIQAAQTRLASHPEDALRDRVSFSVRDVRDALPVENGTVGLATDVFVYFHILDANDRAAYRQRLAEALAPGGVLLVSLALADDGYYSTCPTLDNTGIRTVLDEHAGVGNIMHTSTSLSDELSDRFTPLDTILKVFDGPMHGKSYRRVTLGSLWTVQQ